MICQNRTETGSGFGSFMHSLCVSETSFGKSSKPARQFVHLIAMDKIMIKKYDIFILGQVYSFYVDKSYTCIRNGGRETFYMTKSSYYLYTHVPVNTGWFYLLCIWL